MTWMLFSRSIPPSGSLADPLHVAVHGDLAHRHHLAALDLHQARPVGRPMVLARVGERGVRPHVSNSFRLSSAFLIVSPVGFGPARLIASAATITHSHPRM